MKLGFVENLSAEVVYKFKFLIFPSTDLFQQSLWGINNDLGLLHPHCSSPSKTHEVPEVLRNEGISEKEPEQIIPPRLHHRLHQYNFDFNRTQDMQEHREAT